MDKRYQVFISSTFLDLEEERQAVSQALLRSDCFPAQMENWPAMDAEQMEAIKQIIDESDYYVVISAGKYGSISPETGLSYTEMEYDYAMETGKPIIRLLHKDPFRALAGKQIESKVGVRRKLEAFHKKIKAASVCSFWENADQLEKETVLALLDIKKRKPTNGWVKSSARASLVVENENLELRLRISELENRLKSSGTLSEHSERHRLLRKAIGECLSCSDTDVDRFFIEIMVDFREPEFSFSNISKSAAEILEVEEAVFSAGTNDDIRDILVALNVIDWRLEKGWTETSVGYSFDSYVRAQKYF